MHINLSVLGDGFHKKDVNFLTTCYPLYRISRKIFIYQILDFSVALCYSRRYRIVQLCKQIKNSTNLHSYYFKIIYLKNFILIKYYYIFKIIYLEGIVKR